MVRALIIQKKVSRGVYRVALQSDSQVVKNVTGVHLKHYNSKLKECVKPSENLLQTKWSSPCESVNSSFICSSVSAVDNDTINTALSSRHHVSNDHIVDYSAESSSDLADKVSDDSHNNVVHEFDDNPLFSRPLSNSGNGLMCSSLVKESGFYPSFPIENDVFSPVKGILIN